MSSSMTESSNSNAEVASKSASGGAAPAWKLRETLKQQQDQSKRSNSSKFTRKSGTIDPNLPPAFRQVAMQRMAFDRQQARRKNNDEFVSLNSTHVGKEPTQDDLDDMSSLGSEDSFGDGFGEADAIQEEEVDE
jgi:hypothetical protein